MGVFSVFAENFLDILVCDMTHIKDDSLNE
jgi:hypothetical protein